MVLAAARPGKTRGRIQIGADDPSLTAAGGMLAVTELCGKLGLIEALDEAMGPVKQRRRGFTGGQVLAGMAAAQLAGEDFLVGLDRVRADQAGQHLVPVPGLATSTATGIARRFTDKHWRGAEAGLARATARMVGLLPAERVAELAEGPVTIDIDATDVEVYGSKKRGVAYNYQGQRAGRPHVASWAETEIPLAAGLLSGDQDPRSHVTGLLDRALAALPQAIREGAAAAGRKIALRADAGYFAGELARAAAKDDMAFAIGAKRIPSMRKALGSISDDAWRGAIDMDKHADPADQGPRRCGGRGGLGGGRRRGCHRCGDFPMAVCMSAVIVMPAEQCSRRDRAASPWRNSCAPPPESARVTWLAASVHRPYSIGTIPRSAALTRAA